MIELRGEVSTLRRLFMELLNLQGRIPSSARLHLLLEADRTPATSETLNVELFSLFSTTVSNETTARRNSTCLLGEALMNFRLHCDSDRFEPLTERRAADTALVPPDPQHSNQSNSVATAPVPVALGTTTHPEHGSAAENVIPHNSTGPSHPVHDSQEGDDDPDEVVDGNIKADWVVAPREVI